MASGKEYLNFILEQLSDLNDISYRPMMGEFILYYHGKIVGGIYNKKNNDIGGITDELYSDHKREY